MGESKERRGGRRGRRMGLVSGSSLLLLLLFVPYLFLLEKDLPVGLTITFDSCFLHRRSTRSSLFRPSLLDLRPPSSASPSNSFPSSSISSSGTTTSPSVEYPFESWKSHLPMSMECASHRSGPCGRVSFLSSEGELRSQSPSLVPSSIPLTFDLFYTHLAAETDLRPFLQIRAHHLTLHSRGHQTRRLSLFQRVQRLRRSRLNPLFPSISDLRPYSCRRGKGPRLRQSATLEGRSPLAGSNPVPLPDGRRAAGSGHSSLSPLRSIRLCRGFLRQVLESPRFVRIFWSWVGPSRRGHERHVAFRSLSSSMFAGPSFPSGRYLDGDVGGCRGVGAYRQGVYF